MDQRHVENISKLIRFMDGLSDPKFTMARYTHDCNTPACALGWACKVPSLEEQGLDFRLLTKGGATEITDMAEHVFGDYLGLFSSLLRVKTPLQWAEHARAYLKSRGHEVATQTDVQAQQFKRFMDRLLSPVPLPSESKA